jgi:hypothetical protein
MGDYLNFIDFTKRMDPDGSMAKVAEVLTAKIPFLEDMPVKTGNLPTGNQITIRSDLPEGTWRTAYTGVDREKSEVTQVVDTVGVLNSLSEVDARVLKTSGNSLEARLQEDKTFMKGLSKTLGTAVIYGNQNLNPQQPLGLSPRYPYSDSPNVINAGGSGVDVQSIWLVVWNPDNVYGFVGKGQKAGFTMTDHGKNLVTDANGRKFEAWQTWFEWELGISVADWRQVARLCNVEVDGTTSTGPSVKNLIKLVRQVEDRKDGRAVIYCSKDVLTQYYIAAYDKTNVNLQLRENIFNGELIPYVMGVPMKEADVLVAESALTADPG